MVVETWVAELEPGSMYLVNESGSELFIPDRNGMIMNSARTAQLMRDGSPNQSGSSSQILTINCYINTTKLQIIIPL